MRAYLIDELSPTDMEKIKTFFKENSLTSKLEQIFWIQIPANLLSDIQSQHRNCRPHVFAIELGSNWVKLELFARSLKSMQCRCHAYCTTQQQDHIINFADSMIKQLAIRT